MQVELFEEFTVKEMGAAGTLQVKQVWHGNGIKPVRLLIAQQTPEQLRKLAMGNYERQYNGAVLSGDQYSRTTWKSMQSPSRRVIPSQS